MPSKLNIGPEIKYKASQCNESPSPLTYIYSKYIPPPLPLFLAKENPETLTFSLDVGSTNESLDFIASWPIGTSHQTSFKVEQLLALIKNTVGPDR